MTELKFRAEVVGSQEEEEAKFAEECYEEARVSRSYLFKFKEGIGPLHAHFNFSQDQIELDNFMLTGFAYSEISDGDDIAKEWEKAGWNKLGPRVSWRITPHALEFSLTSGHRYQLRRAALLDYYKNKIFPKLEEV